MSLEVPGGEDPGADPRTQLHRLLDEDPADLYENAPCGYLSTRLDGTIVKIYPQNGQPIEYGEKLFAVKA